MACFLDLMHKPSNMQKVLLVSLVVALAACNNADTNSTGGDSTKAKPDSMNAPMNGKLPEPKGPKPEWASDIDPEMQVVMEKLASYNAPPVESLDAVKARENPTPTTAVIDLVKENNISMPAPMVDTMGTDIPVDGGSIHARVYTPRGGGPFPVIVYYHGGGWVIATNDTYMASAQGLAEQTGAVVVSVEYRKGPEHKFPTAHNDAFAAYKWVWANLAKLKGDSTVAVVGESAGGNMACNVSIMARDAKLPLPVAQVLVYPVAQPDMNTESYKKYAAAKPLNKRMMAWFGQQYFASPATINDPRISLVKANLKGLPPTTIIGAEIDPLADDGKMLRDKLKDAGVAVDYKMYDGVTHEFFGMAVLVPDAKDAQAYAATNLKKAFRK